MIFAAAQDCPVQTDIAANIIRHQHWMSIAAEQGAGLIVFPEMSLTGYLRENAKTNAMVPSDERLVSLMDSARRLNITVVAGAPIQIGHHLYIGSFILFPYGEISIYTKQYLHQGEEKYFTSSLNFNPLLELGGEKVSLAICADIDNPLHPEAAANAGSSFYMPSIFFSPKGIPNAYKQLGHYAKRHSMNILMSNFCGESWKNVAAGRSAFWSNNGELIASLNDKDPGILLVEKTERGWNSQIIQ